MRLTVLVNSIDDLVARRATTLLARTAQRRGHEVRFAGVGDIGWGPRGPLLTECALVDRGDDEASIAATRLQPRQTRAASPGDVVLIRTNPGRDGARRAHHDAALGLLELARQRGVRVLNDPAVLRRGNSKVLGLELPEAVQPVSLVSSHRDQVAAFVQESAGRCVLKPLVGSRGEGVHLVAANGVPAHGVSVDEALDELLPSGPVLAQRFVPGAEQGDTRVILLDGEPLEVGGKLAAARRVPPPTDFRSNIHVGATAQAAVWTAALARAVEATGPWLRRMGLWLVGLDVIGDRVIEVNVFSPGGLGSASEFEAVDFAEAVITRLERRTTRS